MDRRLTFDGGSVGADEVRWKFTPSGGPGGQHANRSSTRVEAALDLTVCGAMSDDTRSRLRGRYGDELRLVVDDTRSQTRNRDIALDRLEAQLRAGLQRRKTRRATRPSKRARQRRLDAKRQRSETKRGRKRIDPTGH